MKKCLLTLAAAGISFACGWGAARYIRNAGGSSTRPKGPVTATRVTTPPVAADASDPGGGAPQSLESFVMHLRLLRKPVDEGAFCEWARTAPLSELEEVIAALGHSPEPSWEIRQLVATLAARDPQAALRRYGEWSEFGRFRLIEGLVEGWARQDPMAALEWLSTQRANAATDDAREAAMRRLAQADPQAALATFREKGWQWDSPKSMETIFRTWVRTDAKTALTEWRILQLELNPPTSPGAESLLNPFTVELVAGLVSHATTSTNEDPVTAAFGWFDPGEWAQIPTGFWQQILTSSDPAKVLPRLEERLEFNKMKEVVGMAMRSSPERGHSILQSLKNPDLRVDFEPILPAAQPDWTGPPLVPQDTGAMGVGEGAGFWEKSITLDP